MLDSIRQPKKVGMFLFKNDELKREGEEFMAKVIGIFGMSGEGKNNEYNN